MLTSDARKFSKQVSTTERYNFDSWTFSYLLFIKEHLKFESIKIWTAERENKIRK